MLIKNIDRTSAMTEIHALLETFIGTEQYWSFPYQSELDKPKTRYTDGVRAFAMLTQSWSIINLIENTQAQISEEDYFQLWNLSSEDGQIVKVSVDDGQEENKRILFERNHLQPFPIGTIKLYCIDGIIMLPSEY